MAGAIHAIVHSALTNGLIERLKILPDVEVEFLPSILHDESRVIERNNFLKETNFIVQ